MPFKKPSSQIMGLTTSLKKAVSKAKSRPAPLSSGRMPAPSPAPVSKARVAASAALAVKPSKQEASSAKPKGRGHLTIRTQEHSQELLKNQTQWIQIRKLSGAIRREQMDSLLKKEACSDKELAEYLADEYNLQKIDLSQLKPTLDICQRISKKVCEKFTLIPVMKVGEVVIVAFADPGDMEAKENASLAIGLKIQPVVAERGDIKKAIASLYEDTPEEEIDDVFDVINDLTAEREKETLNIVDLSSSAQAEPVINSVNKIITKGIRAGASDIHVEIYEKVFRVRFRVDGCLSEMGKLPQNLAAGIVNRIKILSQMDISERRLPQDGRLKAQLGNRVVDLRVSSVPVVHGEKVVMRILNSDINAGGIAKLGMFTEQETLFKKYLGQSQGFILMTGPTGSGKTTTIYSGLMALNTPDKNISTVEDPVEYKLSGINQVQVHSKIKLTFSNVLRTFLRQDPDVILVGEIRDQETAEIAYRAAATGHLVLSTLHTNDTVSTVTRLIEIGIPPYSVAENTTLVIAQRLIRLLCEQCKEPHTTSQEALIDMGLSKEDAQQSSPHIMKKGGGCTHCNNLGYQGRQAVFEILDMTRPLKDGILHNKTLKELKDIAVQDNNMLTLRQAALRYLTKGRTSVNEVLYGTCGDH